MPSDETYIVENGKLYPATSSVGPGGIKVEPKAITNGTVKIELDDVANVFYKVE